MKILTLKNDFKKQPAANIINCYGYLLKTQEKRRLWLRGLSEWLQSEIEKELNEKTPN